MTTQQTAPRTRLDVWYVCDLTLCNFDCSYCASGQPGDGTGSRSRTEMWGAADSVAKLQKILGFIERLPYDVNLRLQTIGEPFVSEEFLREAARMTRVPNVRFVELVTNGSLLKSRLRKMIDEFGADVSKLSLWITFHHTEISLDKLLDNARHAHELGPHVVVNTLLFPDNRELVADLLTRCEKLGIRTNVDLGMNISVAYEGSFVPLLDQEDAADWPRLIANKRMVATSMIAIADPQGLRCSSGHDYIFIADNGDVFPCMGYRRYKPETRLGSALDPAFIPTLASHSMPCEVAAGCTCKEDYLHLEIAQPGPVKDKSMGYWPPSANDPGISDEIRSRLSNMRYRALRVIK